jgi:AraC-like DNA-binding protein
MRIIFDHQLVLFSEGTFSVEIDGAVHSCQPNSFIIIPPGRPHASALESKTGIRHWVHFNWVYGGPELIGRRFAFLPGKVRADCIQPAPDFVPNKILHGPIPIPEVVFDLHLRLEKRWINGYPYEKETCRALLLEILLGLFVDKHKLSAKVSRHDGLLVRRAHDLLSKLACEPMNRMPSIRTALAGLGCSYAHVSNIFKKAYGISPVRFINAQRLERARLLLRDTDLSVSEIAWRTGFKDPCYFARLFRQHTGLSAREYAGKGK